MLLTISNGLAKIFRPTTISSLVSCSNKFGTTNLLKGNLKNTVRYRLILNRGEVFRFPACREVSVLSGVAWVTIAGKDIILNAQEQATLSSQQDSAVISALGNVPLIVEVL